MREHITLLRNQKVKIFLEQGQVVEICKCDNHYTLLGKSAQIAP